MWHSNKIWRVVVQRRGIRCHEIGQHLHILNGCRADFWPKLTSGSAEEEDVLCVCCSVLRCVAVCCSAEEEDALYVCCSALHCVVVCCRGGVVAGYIVSRCVVAGYFVSVFGAKNWHVAVQKRRRIMCCCRIHCVGRCALFRIYCIEDVLFRV